MRTKQSLQLEREPFRFSLKLKKRINLNLKKSYFFSPVYHRCFYVNIVVPCIHWCSMYNMVVHWMLKQSGLLDVFSSFFSLNWFVPRLKKILLTSDKCKKNQITSELFTSNRNHFQMNCEEKVRFDLYRSKFRLKTILLENS